MGSARGYDRLAVFYDVLADIVFGGALHRAQIQFLDDIPPGSKVLVLGGGTGRWLRHPPLRRANPNITYIDVSSAMIGRARRNGDGMNIRFIEGTQGTLNGGEDFDVVVLFCYLDLFDDHVLPQIVARITRSMKPGGRWLVVDFVSSKRWHEALLFVMYVFFSVVTGLKNRTLPQWPSILERHGIRQEKHREFYGKFIRSSSLISSR